MTPPRRVRTERLDLRPADPSDLEALFPIFSDPAGWWYEPAARHAEPATTLAFLERAARRWSEGLSYWTVRLTGADEPIGLGGVQRHKAGGWNLSYRIAVSEQGHGYAAELGRAAQQAAAGVDADVAVIAWALEQNTPSRRVAENLGLVNRGLRIDANDGQPRLAYADRTLDAEHYPPA